LKSAQESDVIFDALEMLREEHQKRLVRLANGDLDAREPIGPSEPDALF